MWWNSVWCDRTGWIDEKCEGWNRMWLCMYHNFTSFATQLKRKWKESKFETLKKKYSWEKRLVFIKRIKGIKVWWLVTLKSIAIQSLKLIEKFSTVTWCCIFCCCCCRSYCGCWSCWFGNIWDFCKKKLFSYKITWQPAEQELKEN